VLLFTIIVSVIAAIAGLLYILEYFGIKPEQPWSGFPMPLSRKWKLGIMLSLVGISLALSGYAAYRGYHPKIVEKSVIVEKPVSVTVPCPEPPEESKPPKPQGHPPLSGQQQSGAGNVQSGSVTQGPCSSNQQGGTGNQSNINCVPPPLQLDWSAKPTTNAGNNWDYNQLVTVKANVDFHPVSFVIVCDQEIKDVSPGGVFLGTKDWGVTQQSNKIGFVYYDNPSLAPGVPLIITVSSDKPFSVLEVKPANIQPRKSAWDSK
jgi:hypothetical protein